VGHDVDLRNEIVMPSVFVWCQIVPAAVVPDDEDDAGGDARAQQHGSPDARPAGPDERTGRARSSIAPPTVSSSRVPSRVRYN
jgi:hypothetical protein